MSSGGSSNQAMNSNLAAFRAGPLEAVLFDVDGTLCDSDPLHFEAFRDLLQEAGFQGGVPIDKGFYVKDLTGSLEDKYDALFPEDLQKALQFKEDKEVRLAKEKLMPEWSTQALQMD